MKEFPLLSMFNIHENLLESLLELQNYADVQAVLAKYDGETCTRLIHMEAFNFTEHHQTLNISALINDPFTTRTLNHDYG